MTSDDASRLGSPAWADDQRRWWSTDALRVVAALSVPLAGWYAGPASAACLFLVVGGVMALRLTAPTPVIDVLGQLVLLAVAWAAVTGAYEHVSWLDIPAHTAGTVVAVHVLWQLLRARDDRDVGFLRAAVDLAGYAALLSLLWEVGEWLGHEYVSSDIRVGYADTVGDLVWGTVAGPLLAVVHAVDPSRRPTTGERR